jgi:HEAT repeat protein
MANIVSRQWDCRLRPALWLACALVALILLGPAVAVWASPAEAALPSASQQSDAYPGLDDPDPAVRAQTVQDIRQAGDRNAVYALIAHIEDPDQQVGLYIAQGLVELATYEQLAPLLLLTNRGTTDGRWRAAYVLGQRKDPRALPALMRALRDPDVLVTRTAAESLANIGTSSAIRALMEMLKSERPAVVHAAKWGLLTLGDAAVPALAAGLDSGNRALEINASLVLEAIGTPAARRVMQPNLQ